MNRNNNRVLAIDPGSREMGLVVLDNTELIFYCVKTLKQFRPETKLKKAIKRIITKLISEYGIKTIVVENGWFSQENSPLFRAAFTAIEGVAGKNRIGFATYAPKTIRKQICGDGRATKAKTARQLANLYPELEIYLEQNYRWKEKYWLNVFDALAAGLTHVKDNEPESK